MEWRTIPKFENYEISSEGEVRRGDKLLSKCVSTSGYYHITLRSNLIKKTFYVHRLVAMVFINNQNNKLIVNHKNGNRLDNRSINLEWITSSENSIHGYQNGRRVHNEKKIIAADDDGNIIACFRSGADAAKTFCLHNSSIIKAIHFNRKCAGYWWAYHADT